MALTSPDSWSGSLERRLRRIVKRWAVSRKSYDDMVLRASEWAERNAALDESHRLLAVEHENLRSRHEDVLRAKQAFEDRYRTWVPPGHFYSPFPAKEEIDRRAAALFDVDARPEAVDLREADQIALFGELADLAADLPFTAEPNERHRYFFDNPEYSWADAITLHTMLRHLRPRRVIEVGSGYSTAMTLDTIEGWLDDTELTCVEPNPQLLESLLRPGDGERVRILGKPVQDVPVETFQALEAGDVLFIDSTHVVKAGSDVNYLFFEVLPRLPDGVWIHLHDVFFPFEYPMTWLTEGRAWQEDYLLRAFLMYNDRFEICWFQQYMWIHHRRLLEERIPMMANNPGGNIWLRKVAGHQ
ncbi:class I SAM-dependent methyltransferase [Amycolatopsis japonica]|uniref:class I SAM-dependent methyltransferase n=1 Tax=Amycolatopsis japonica TaxID=208439 RepID=UPI003671D9EB